jgi:hypothetical protein
VVHQSASKVKRSICGEKAILRASQASEQLASLLQVIVIRCANGRFVVRIEPAESRSDGYLDRRGIRARQLLLETGDLSRVELVARFNLLEKSLGWRVRRRQANRDKAPDHSQDNE